MDNIDVQKILEHAYRLDDRSFIECLSTIPNIYNVTARYERTISRTYIQNISFLHYLALKGHLSIIKKLISNGVDIDLENQYGDKILSFAILGGHMATIEYLVGLENVDINHVNRDGIPVLFLAYDNLDVIKCLIEYGADINIVNWCDNENNIFLTEACSSSYSIKTIKYLVKHGADINYSDGETRTPLMYASSNGRIDIVKCLVKHKADINYQNSRGETAISRAIQCNKLRVARYLRRVLVSREIPQNQRPNSHVRHTECPEHSTPSDVQVALKIASTLINLMRENI